jgi:TRAP transporter TAXI family solute receptor
MAFCLFAFSTKAADNGPLRIASGRPGSSHYDVANVLAKIWKDELKQHVSVITDSDGSLDNCNAIMEGKADLALAQSDVARELFLSGKNNSNIRVIMPLYDQVFFLIYKSGMKHGSLAELVKGKRVGVSQKGSGTYFLTQQLFKHFGIDTTQYTRVYINDTKLPMGEEADIICTVTGFNNSKLPRLLNQLNGEIYSFDNPELRHLGSNIDGFCLNYPLASSYVISKEIYGKKPTEPILTLAVKNLLLARADLDPILVYDLAKSLYSQKEYLVQINTLFQEMPEKVSANLLGFPLHEGAQMFYERDRPSFFERYAEVLGTFVSFIVVLFGLIPVGLNYWNTKKREKIILSYYKLILGANAAIESSSSRELLKNKIDSLEELERELFQLVLDHKLTTDTAFITLITYLQNSIDKISSVLYRVNKAAAKAAREEMH